MFDRLEKIVARYEELTHLLADPAVISQPQRFRDLSKEYFDLTPIVQTYQRYKKAKTDFDGLKHLANATGDAEIGRASCRERVYSSV